MFITSVACLCSLWPQKPKVKQIKGIKNNLLVLGKWSFVQPLVLNVTKLFTFHQMRSCSTENYAEQFMFCQVFSCTIMISWQCVQMDTNEVTEVGESSIVIYFTVFARYGMHHSHYIKKEIIKPSLGLKMFLFLFCSSILEKTDTYKPRSCVYLTCTYYIMTQLNLPTLFFLSPFFIPCPFILFSPVSFPILWVLPFSNFENQHDASKVFWSLPLGIGFSHHGVHSSS